MFAAAVAAVNASAPVSAATVSVEEMIVGRSRILMDARTLAVPAGSVTVNGRRCTVVAATPLAALLDAQPFGAPTPSLRDYGHCGSRPADSAQLFVTALGRDANRNQDGWEYKVGHRAGTTGAADPSGALGDGKLLHNGQRVLWFWCVASAGGCQRTLETTMSTYTPQRDGLTTVTVIGYDNYGHGRAVQGATVTFDGANVRVGADGGATLRAPSRRGRYVLRASAAHLVPAFPRIITVK